MPLPGEGEDDGEAGRGGEGDRPLRGFRAPPSCFDSRHSRHVSIKPDRLETPLRGGEERCKDFGRTCANLPEVALRYPVG